VLHHDPALQAPATDSVPDDGRDGPIAVEPAPMTAIHAAAPPEARPRGRTRTRHGLRPKAAALTAAAVLVGSVVAVAQLNANRTAHAAELEPGAVGLVDIKRRAVSAQAVLGERPSALVADRGTLWAALPVRGVLASVDASAPSAVRELTLDPGLAGAAVGDGALWVTQPDQRSLVRIDAASGRVARRIPVGGLPGPVASTPGTVWVGNRLDDTVSRVDTVTGAVVATIAVGRDPVALSATGDAVWVVGAGDASLTRISVAGSTVQRFRLSGSPTDVLATHGAVWISDATAGTVARVDPVTGSIRSSTAVGAGAADLAATDEAVVVGSAYDGWLAVLAPPTGDVVRRLDLGASPLAVHSDGRRVWAGSAAAVPAGRRGGTLRVAVPQPIESPDPAAASSSNGWAVTSLTHAGLTAVRRAGGADGTVVVPDLAVTLPVPTDGGLTWTFRLRPGITYSTGGTVQPSDVRPSFERLVGDGVPYYAAIAGADRCSPQACDLSDGITADDNERTVTFHLARPDPDFLAGLALPIAAVLPASAPPVVSPDDASGFAWSGFAATGAYRVLTVTGTTVVLVRNENFRSWSGAAAPDGVADRIEIRYGVDAAAAVRDVLAARVDIALDPPPGQLDELATRFPTQLQRYDEPGVQRLLLDTRNPPFNSVLARRAVAIAVDRQAAAAALAPDLLAAPGCQVLPPVVPGYQPYCPFGTGAGDRARRPDVAAARVLVDRSGTTGARVRLLAPPPRRAAAEVTARALRDIGYAVDLRIIRGDYFRLVADTRTTPEAHLAGWYAESPTAASFVRLVRCAAYVERADQNTNLNVAGYCDQTAERLIETAHRAQQDDPAAAASAWRAVDRHLTDTVAWVPLATLQRAVVRAAGASPVVYIPLLGPALELTSPAAR
jgi:peptide/nickel transport system substrate-binding protein